MGLGESEVEGQWGRGRRDRGSLCLLDTGPRQTVRAPPPEEDVEEAEQESSPLWQRLPAALTHRDYLWVTAEKPPECAGTLPRRVALRAGPIYAVASERVSL